MVRDPLIKRGILILTIIFPANGLKTPFFKKSPGRLDKISFFLNQKCLTKLFVSGGFHERRHIQ
jgi:hypothetical protein